VSEYILVSKAEEFASRLERRVKEKLGEIGLRVDVFAEYEREREPIDVFKYYVDVDVDVSGYIGEVPPCLWLEDVYEDCGEYVKEEGGGERDIEMCVSGKINGYIEEYGDTPFEFKYAVKNVIEAWVEARVEEDSRKICVRDILRIKYHCGIASNELETYGWKELEDIINSLVEEIASYVRNVVDAVKTLSR